MKLPSAPFVFILRNGCYSRCTPAAQFSAARISCSKLGARARMRLLYILSPPCAPYLLSAAHAPLASRGAGFWFLPLTTFNFLKLHHVLKGQFAHSLICLTKLPNICSLIISCCGQCRCTVMLVSAVSDCLAALKFTQALYIS